MFFKQYRQRKERLTCLVAEPVHVHQPLLNEALNRQSAYVDLRNYRSCRMTNPISKLPWEPGYLPEDPDVITLPEIRKDPFEAPRELVRLAPRYHVVLHNDDDHSYEYVIEMLGDLFGHNRLIAFQMACTVDFTGRVVVDTTSKERAELKRDQIHNYGSDWRIPQCSGSMSASIEPAEEE